MLRLPHQANTERQKMKCIHIFLEHKSGDSGVVIGEVAADSNWKERVREAINDFFNHTLDTKDEYRLIKLTKSCRPAYFDDGKVTCASYDSGTTVSVPL